MSSKAAIMAALGSRRLFNAVQFTGNSSAGLVVPTGVKADLVYGGQVGNSAKNFWDSVRGASAALRTDTVGSELTVDGATAFGSKSFTLGSDGVINNSGSDSFAYVWAEDSAVFDIVTNTGDGSAGTIAHGLDTAAAMIWAKNRDDSDSFAIYHDDLGAGNYMTLDGNIGSTADTTVWNNTAPTSSVFSVGTSVLTNNNTEDYVFYLFAERAGRSHAFTYTGNETTNNITGFGFRPRGAYIQRTDVSNNSAKATLYRENVRDSSTYTMFMSDSGGESSTANVIFSNDGINLSAAASNVSGGNYIGFAWA